MTALQLRSRTMFVAIPVRHRSSSVLLGAERFQDPKIKAPTYLLRVIYVGE